MLLKGEVSHKFAVISKPKNVCLHQQKQKKIFKFVINNFYHPSAMKLSISASGQRQSRLVWIET